MLKTILPLAALLLWAPALRAQQGGDVPKRLERKAETIAHKDADFAKLNDAEERLVVSAIAKKLRDVRRYNWTHLFSKKSLSKTDVGVYVDDADLDALYARYAKSINKREVVSEQQKQDAAPPPELVARPPAVEFIEVHGDPFHGLFQDNEWELLGGSDDAQDLQAQADDALAQAGPQGRITGLTIHSSASTLLNTGKAAAMSHLQLSQARANAALKYILAYLDGKGVRLDQSQVTVDASGENGDGTSGPAAPSGKGAKGNGQPALKDTADYDQYKFVDVKFLVEKPVEKDVPPEIIQKEGDTHSRVVTLDIDVKTSHWLKFRRHTHLRVTHRHTPRRHPGKHKAIGCPDFH
ncbi:MAG: hypothetical protein NTY77_19105 [Elusimicrobia bacterium]|nr:hypothetical protein [Elusimicrobiota bacterium]